MIKTLLALKKAAVASVLTIFATSLTTPASAQPLFDGCPSGPILERFVDFGRTGKMPPELGKWLNTPDAQYVEPWKPFTNVEFVVISVVDSH